MYNLSALEAGVAGMTFSGKLQFVKTTQSTNSDAMAAARLGAPHGTVYFADEQTAGRGRGDHRWHSAVGEGLYVSVLLRPKIDAARLPLLPLAAGLAAAQAIQEVAGVSIDLRWPNDLLIRERKTGGILVEAQTESAPGGGRAAFAVVGVGINVHQREFAPDLATAATSLDLEAGRRIARGALLLALLKFLERETDALMNSDAALAIPERVERSSSWIRGRRVQVHGPQACEGVTAGLDKNGFLRVETIAGVVTVQTGGMRAVRQD
jgi:BirA family biotin operon repressor/biotin-[acetyl-CoA-carboxylase] ligase